MKLSIPFADLTHTKQGISNIAFPFGISLVASYAKKKLDNKIEIEVFKYPDNFKNYLEKNTPKIVGFSNFSWTFNLSYEFAKRIKEKSPKTIIVFGGPNYPKEPKQQEEFLLFHPKIDFYIQNEGEQGFVNLFKKLEESNFDVRKFKENHIKTGNCHYAYNSEIIKGEILPRLEDLDDIPSPYLSGLSDKFFDGILIPVIQTTRGCPFSCTYCQEGQKCFNKITRFSHKRIKNELENIVKKIKVPNLIVTDSNFGMYKQDLKTCEDLASLKEKYGWPKYIDTCLGKNKDIIVKAVSILSGDICLSAPVQSTNPEVLKNINRKNISMEKTIKIIEESKFSKANSFSEVILCLPGDTKKAHYKSMTDMIDLGINVVRSHQLLMLPGSEISTNQSRQEYNMETKFRLQPRCFGNYELYNKTFPVCEIDEICVANNTMSYKDYLNCRTFDLTVEIFNNNGIFQELTTYLNQNKILTSNFIKKINQKIQDSSLKSLYNDYLKETKNSLWESKSELENFIKQPGKVEEYLKEELRNNEQLKYRAVAFFTKMSDLHKIAFDSAEQVLKDESFFDEKQKNYFNELAEFSLTKKNNLLSNDIVEKKRFHYDFISLTQEHFNKNPFSYFVPEGIDIEFKHSDEQKAIFSSYIKQYGSSMNGLGYILSRSHTNKFYREIRKV